MAPTFRQLQAAKAVLESGSFNGAAARLCMSQVAISRHIAALEKHVGARIFLRDRGQAARLSQAGEGFVAQFADLLSQTSSFTPATDDEVVRVSCDAVLGQIITQDIWQLLETDDGLEIAFTTEDNADIIYSLNPDDSDGASNRDILGNVETALLVSPDCLDAQCWAEGEVDGFAMLALRQSRLDPASEVLRNHDGLPLQCSGLRYAPDLRAMIALALRGSGGIWLPTALVLDHIETGHLVDLEMDMPQIHCVRRSAPGSSHKQAILTVQAAIDAQLRRCLQMS